MHKIRGICSEIDLERSRYVGYAPETYLGNPRYGYTHKGDVAWETEIRGICPGDVSWVLERREIRSGDVSWVLERREIRSGDVSRSPEIRRIRPGDVSFVSPGIHCDFMVFPWGRKKIKASGGERNNFPQSIRG